MSRPSSIVRMLASRRLSAVTLSLLLGAASIVPMVARADDAPAAAPQANAAPAQPPATAHIDGFRSAHFGMNQAEVRKAILADFNIKAGAIKSMTDDIQKTATLQIDAPDVIPNGGTAVVNYTFGYKSKKLIQIRVVWSKDIDQHVTPAQLWSNSKLLQNYFGSAGYQVLATNAVTNDGVLSFQGRDADGHMTVLMLHGSITQGKDKQQRVMVFNALTLDYVEDPAKPDIYQLPSGKF